MKYAKLILAIVAAALVILFGGAAIIDYVNKQNVIDNSAVTYDDCSVLPRTHADVGDLCSESSEVMVDGDGDVVEQETIVTKMPDKSKDGCLVDCGDATPKPKP